MKAKDFVKGAAVGVIAGAIAGILFAPKSGKETRADIKKHYDEMKEQIAKELSTAGKFTKETYSKVVKKVVSAYEKGKKISKEEAGEAIDKLESGFEEVKKRVSGK